MRIRTLTILGMAALLAPSLSGGQELRFGQDGNVTWEGAVSGLQDVSTSAPEYVPALDPTTTEVGIAPGGRIELDHPDHSEALLPLQLDREENRSASLLLGGGSIVSETANDLSPVTRAALLEGLLTEDPNGEAFERKEADFIFGTLITVDMGATFGVRLIRFFPRNTVFPSPTTPFQSDYLRNFELRIHDGVQLNEAGAPALGTWESYLTVTDNPEPVTSIDFDPARYLRFIRLRATEAIPFEIEKIQIFGEGYFPTAQYLSPVVDLGNPSNWGQIYLDRTILGDSTQTNIVIRTRTGGDATPFVYNRREVGKPDAEDIPFSVDNPEEPMSRQEFLRLPVNGTQADPWERGAIEADLDNWSPWSPPYSIDQALSPAGVRNTSPAPRTYLQFRVDFSSQELFSTNVLNGVSFEFTRPALADALVAEIFPREVEAARDISFVYAVRAEVMPGQEVQGFNSFELSTPGPVERIERIEIIDASGESLLDHTFAVQNAVTEGEGDVRITSITDGGFSVRFSPPIQADDTVLKIHFVTRIFAYSNDFSGRGAVEGTDAFQWIQPGEAAPLHEDDAAFDSGITVLSSGVSSTGLIGGFTLDNPVLTPNGDGANDLLGLRFEVLTVLGADIRIAAFDVSGRHVATIFEHHGDNGPYAGDKYAGLNWDGKDEHGDLLPPGLYIVRLEVEGDARSSTAVRAVGIAY